MLPILYQHTYRHPLGLTLGRHAIGSTLKVILALKCSLKKAFKINLRSDVPPVWPSPVLHHKIAKTQKKTISN